MQTPTHDDEQADLWACVRTHDATPALARLLRDAVPPDDRNDLGETALHVAAARGNDEAVQLLLCYGADLLAADWESGWTPLHRSLYHQHLSTTLLLLRHAQTRFGKKFARKYLHETRDHAHQSPMQLLSTRLQRQRKPEGEFVTATEACDGGHVYTFGKRDYQLGYHLPNADVQVSPRLVELPATSPIVQLSASKYHTIALNAAGECFVWGFGKGGRLGTGNEFDRIEPTRLVSLETTPMKKVAAVSPLAAILLQSTLLMVLYTPGVAIAEVSSGAKKDVAEKLALSDWHTCVVLRCSHNGRSLGQVWQFGYGSYRPSRVNIPFDSATSSGGAAAIMCDTWVPMCKQRGMDVVEVSCAQNHSIALSASGAVFTWGHNVPALSHQSGSNASPTPSPSAPQKVELGQYGPVTSVCASQDHCAVVTREGDLVTWGCGQQGVLGHGRGNTWQPSPKRVSGVKKAVAVAAGHQHTAVLVAPILPDFNSVEGVAAPDAVPSLVELVERKVAAYVDVANCVLVWQYAERYAAFRLQKYCLDYMRNNWDAVLDAVGRDRMDTLFEIMLPQLEEPEPEEKASAIASIEVAQKPTKDKRIGKLPSSSSSKNASATKVTTVITDAQKDVRGDEQVAARADDSFGKTPMTPSKPNGRRKSKSNKFVPLTSFMANKPVITPTRDAGTPWGLHASSAHLKDKKLSSQSKCASPASPVFVPAANALSEAFPLPASSLRKSSFDGASQRQRKASIGSHPSASPRISFSPLPVSGKHMLGYDGVEYEQATAFSLDAFIKQPARRGARGKVAAPTWSSQSAIDTEHRSKTLKEIQQEEEAAAAREREAKARLGGGVAPARRSQSTVNSWGLCRPPDHVSLADVQKLQEEQEFIDQQRQILAEIEREQAAKARTAAAAAAATSTDEGRGHRSKAAPGGSRRARKPTSAVASGSVSTAADGARNSQSKQNKQKKAKERKAARKAAGETFAAGPTAAAAAVGSSSSARSASRKKSGPQKPKAQEKQVRR
ncbi:hypothetical protein PF008_g12510 [Phytophthora fragariae]|uniref:Uncharacterized protein n=1 Tax=Phytophthora fragariae TaxID=53985 RepID=A0A6G0RMR4_9STRA|nr:hypothetical protein PF008_g12510 [Phytophthora fragariae]